MVCAWGLTRSAEEFELRPVSSPPDIVSGGDVLVRVSVPDRSHWVAQLDGRDVTRSFHPAMSSGHLLGLLRGLHDGKNSLEVRVNGTIKSKLEIINHPLMGPIFSGPHQEPFVCQTVDNGLGAALDADCSATTAVQYYYKSMDPVRPSVQTIIAMLGSSGARLPPGYKVYDPAAPLPADVAQTVTTEGRTVPYIVRRELGTINRAVYDIRFLYQPDQPLPTPWTRSMSGWNGRLLYAFGGGCGAGYHQGTLDWVAGTLQEPIIAQGYALATSTFNICQNTFNDKVSAETLSMVKEHFIKQFGEPVHTIGWGGSGGAIQQYMIAQNYPGLLDGLIASVSFPDQETVVQTVADCQLLDRAFQTAKQRWTDVQKTAASGFATWRTCVDKWNGAMYLDPQRCDSSIPKDRIYDRLANPKGVRCDRYDDEINVFGRDPETGIARRPLDNVGVQYGLVALNAGKIDAEQFVELNEQIGGYDYDGHIVARRMIADAETLRTAYRAGLVLTGAGGLSQTPVIDWRSYSDDLADNHDRFRSLVTQARLAAVNGNADNQVILVFPRDDFFTTLLNSDSPTSPVVQRERALVGQMDRWLDNVAADSAPGLLSAKVVRNKPSDLADGCVAIDGERIVERAANDGVGRCNQLYPPHGDPRIAAGGPLTDDILKCALKPIGSNEYFRSLTAAQLDRLKAVFPSGVCDYSQPGVEYEATKRTWQRFN